MRWPWCALYILLIDLSVVPRIHGLGILLPLYIYPNTNCAAWSPVFDAISANSNAQWYIIINPDTGPGPTDELYETCVTEIPPSVNQVIMGFVDTTAGNVLGDIDTYAGWPTSSRPHGIFFDEISPTASQLSTYQSYVSHAQSQGFTFIGLDPGQTVTDASYFSIADLINTYENSYSSFNPASLTGTMSKQSVILVNSPTTGTYTTVISQLESLGVEAVYISTVADTSQTLPAQLSEFASEVASAGGGDSSSGSSGTSGTTSSSDSTGTKTNSNGSAPSVTSSTPSNPSTGSGSSTTTGSVSGSSSSLHSSTPSSSQSTLAKGVGIQTSSAQSPGASGSSSSPGAPNTNQSPVANHKGPPIAAIVGAVLGALIILLILLVVFLCLRRRRKSAAPEAAVPFIEVHNLNPTEALTLSVESCGISGATLSQSWNTDIKASLAAPEASTSGDNRDTTMTDPNLSVRVSYQTTARLSGAPTYGSAWESLGSTSGPPPAYHNDD